MSFRNLFTSFWTKTVLAGSPIVGVWGLVYYQTSPSSDVKRTAHRLRNFKYEIRPQVGPYPRPEDEKAIIRFYDTFPPNKYGNVEERFFLFVGKSGIGKSTLFKTIFNDRMNVNNGARWKRKGPVIVYSGATAVNNENIILHKFFNPKLPFPANWRLFKIFHHPDYIESVKSLWKRAEIIESTFDFLAEAEETPIILIKNIEPLDLEHNRLSNHLGRLGKFGTKFILSGSTSDPKIGKEIKKFSHIGHRTLIYYFPMVSDQIWLRKFYTNYANKRWEKDFNENSKQIRKITDNFGGMLLKGCDVLSSDDMEEIYDRDWDYDENIDYISRVIDIKYDRYKKEIDNIKKNDKNMSKILKKVYENKEKKLPYAEVLGENLDNLIERDILVLRSEGFGVDYVVPVFDCFYQIWEELKNRD